jgi:hypothetical protein
MIDQGAVWDAQSAVVARRDEPQLVASARRSAPNPWRFSTRGVAIRLFITCWLVFVLHFATNTVREIYPALSLGDHLSFDVSEYAGLHPDIFEVPGRGAFINNNPGASILGAIPYALSRPITDCVVEHVQRARASNPEAAPREYDSQYPMAREFYREAYKRGLDVKLGLAAGVMQAFCMAPLSALSAVVMFYILVSLTSSVRGSLALSFLYALATPVFYRTAQLNQNLLLCHFALFAFALLCRPWDDPLYPKKPRYLLAGLLCGWAVVLDYSGLVVLLVLSIYGLARRSSLPAELRSRADIWYFALGVMFWGACLMAYQWMAFGNPFYPAQHYMPPATFTGYGYRGMDVPHLDLLWQTAFGIRFGLFTSAPLLLLALYAPGWFDSRLRIVGRREMFCIISFTLAFFLFCAANQYTRMQFNTGVRHIVPVVPFLFLLAAGVLRRLPKLVAVLIGILTTYWSWCLAMYRDVEQGLGVFESLKHITLEGFSFPWMVTLEKMGYVSAASAAPLLLLMSAIVCAIWTVRASGVSHQMQPLARSASSRSQ